MSTFEQLVEDEMARAGRLHAPPHNRDDAYGIFLEEFHEVAQEVFASPRDRCDDALRTELVQTASTLRRWADAFGLLDRDTFWQRVRRYQDTDAKLRPPSASDHESLVRLLRAQSAVEKYVLAHEAAGVVAAAFHHDAWELTSALVRTAAVCRRWAEDRRLVETPVPTGD